MPQMAPMSWILLSLMFFLSTFLFFMMNYFNMNYKKSKDNMIKKNNVLNWKW